MSTIKQAVTVRELTNNKVYELWFKTIRNAFRSAGIYYLINDQRDLNASIRVKDADQGTGLMIITNSLDDIGQQYIVECETVKEALDKLKPLYSKEDTVISLNNEFQALKWKSQSAQIFINELNSIRLRLQAIDPNANNDRFVAKLMSEIPEMIKYVKRDFEMMDMRGTKIDLEELQTIVIKAHRRELQNSTPRTDNNQQSNLNSSFFHQQNNLRRPFRNNQRNNNNSNNQSNNTGPYHRRCGKRHPFGQCTQNNNRTCSCGQRHPYDSCPNNRSHLFNESNQSNQIQNPNQGGQQSQTRSINTGESSNNQQRNNNQNRNNRSSLPNNANVPNQPPTQSNDALSFCNVYDYNGLDANKLYLDNCGTEHSTGDLAKMTNYVPFDTPANMISSNGGVALGKGEIKTISYIQGVQQPITLKDVLYLPNSPITIVSQLKLEDKGCIPNCSSDGVFNYICFELSGKTVIKAKRKINSPDWRLYITCLKFAPLYNFMTMTKAHQLLAHANDQKIMNTVKCVSGLSIDQNESHSPNCETCIVSKSRRRTFNHTLCKEQTPGFVLHTDINEFNTRSIGGSRYAIVFVCEATRYKRVYFMPDMTAGEVRKAILKCINDQYLDLGYFPRRIHSDKGRNYLSNEVQTLLREKHISWSDSSAYNHEQNGLAEKTHLDLTNMTNALLNANKMPKRVWSVAMSHAVYLNNRLYHSSIKTTPYEAYTGSKPDLSNLREFGSKILVHIPKHKRNDKLSPKAKEMIFVGHTKTTVNYLVMDLNHNSVTDTTTVYFIDQPSSQNKPNNINLVFSKVDSQTESSSNEEDETSHDDEDDDDPQDFDVNELVNSTLAEQQQTDDPPNVPEQSNEAIDSQESTSSLDANATIIPAPQIYEYLIKVTDVVIPKNLKELHDNSHKDFFLAAMDHEHMNWLAYEAYTFVRSTGKEKLIRSHWIFSVKSTDGVHVSRFKARLVLDGSQIKEKPDYSPVVNNESLRTVLTYAVKKKLHVHTLDFTSAYLNSGMAESYYMNQVPLYEIPNLRDHIAKLNKWAYGLPASGFEWYSTLKNKLFSLGFKQSKIDECIFYDEVSKLIILVYVDDLLVVSECIDTVKTFKHLISQDFKCKDGGPLKKFLGIEFVYQQEQQIMHLSLKSKILDLFKLNATRLPNPTKIPLDERTDFDLQSPQCRDVFHFRSNIGQLNYISRVRPDIVTYVNRLSRYMKSPTQHHDQLLLKVISYLYNTINYVLTYDGTKGGGLYAYSDSNYVSNSSDGKSYTGTVVLYCGMPILWSSRKQSIIASDNCMAELYALNFSLNRLISIFNLMSELNLLCNSEKILNIYLDNKSAQSIAQTGLGTNSRHYSTPLLYIRDFIVRNQVKLAYIQTSLNLADLFTKLVSNKLFYQFRDQFGIVNTHKRTSDRLTSQTTSQITANT